uniref:Putative secreted protein n=1 Tax=Ixodes ricinus TaxID=34613 RepID=A0A6B0U7M1_IXORI
MSPLVLASAWISKLAEATFERTLHMLARRAPVKSHACDCLQLLLGCSVYRRPRAPLPASRSYPMVRLLPFNYQMSSLRA